LLLLIIALLFSIVISRFVYCLSFTAYIFLCATSLNRSLSSARQSVSISTESNLHVCNSAELENIKIWLQTES